MTSDKLTGKKKRLVKFRPAGLISRCGNTPANSTCPSWNGLGLERRVFCLWISTVLRPQAWSPRWTHQPSWMCFVGGGPACQKTEARPKAAQATSYLCYTAWSLRAMGTRGCQSPGTIVAGFVRVCLAPPSRLMAQGSLRAGFACCNCLCMWWLVASSRMHGRVLRGRIHPNRYCVALEPWEAARYESFSRAQLLADGYEQTGPRQDCVVLARDPNFWFPPSSDPGSAARRIPTCSMRGRGARAI